MLAATRVSFAVVLATFAAVPALSLHPQLISVLLRDPGNSSLLTQGHLNLTTGEYKMASTVVLPTTSCPGGDWLLGEGTQGQSSAVFWMNGTWFFLAQERCRTSLCARHAGRTALMGMSLDGAGDSTKPRVYASFHGGGALDQYNIAWSSPDIIVIVPEAVYEYELQCTATRLRTLRVSEYDRQVRTEAALFETIDGQSSAQAACDAGTTGWVKVNGPAWHDGHSVLYTVETFMDNGAEQLPRRLVGRDFGAGAKDASHANDTVQLQAMTSTEARGDALFLGLGLCCAESWCDAACQKHPGALSLVAHRGGGELAYVLALLNGGQPLAAADFAAAVRLGVLVSGDNWFAPPSAAHVLVAGHIVSFALAADEAGHLTAKEDDTSPKVAVEPLMWQMGRFGFVQTV